MDDVAGNQSTRKGVGLLGNDIDIPDLEVTNISRRKDGYYIICSNGKVVVSLSERQMRIVLAIANAEFGYLNRSEIHAAVFPDRPRRQLRHPVMTKFGLETSAAIPLSPSQRASMCRSLHRLSNLGLIETAGGETAEPNASTKSIAKWVKDHPAVLEETGG